MEELKKSFLLFVACLFFIFGIAFGSLFSLKNFLQKFFLIFSLLCLGQAAVFYFLKKKKIFLLFWLAAFFCLGVWRFCFTTPIIDSHHLSFYLGEKVILRGVIDDEPSEKEKSIYYGVGQLKILRDDFFIQYLKQGKPADFNWQNFLQKPIEGRLLLVSPKYPQLSYGEEIFLECLLEKPKSFNDFDYEAYLNRQNIFALCSFPKKLEKTGKFLGSFWQAKLYSLKSQALFLISRLFPEPNSSFLAGLLFGAKKTIPSDLREAFQKTGTAHLVALSGFNISIVASFITRSLAFLWIPIKAAFPLSLLGIIGFVLLTGAQASVVRAGIMGILVLLARNFGRCSNFRNALTLSAALMVWVNPKILFFDIGFQLSFAATLGLFLLAPYFQEKLKFFPNFLNAREVLSSSAAALIFTLPLTMHYFKNFSYLALLANLLVVPLVPVVMLLGFWVVFLAFFFYPFGEILAWFVWPLLEFEIRSIKFLSSFPNLQISFSLFWVIVFYFLIFLFVYKIKYAPAQNSGKNKIP